MPESRRAYLIANGATATDHGIPSARTADLAPANAVALLDIVAAGMATPEQAEIFRAQVLTEMAQISVADGLVMQINLGSVRNHNAAQFSRFGSAGGVKQRI